MTEALARLPKAERTRRQILAAAELRFAEHGFEKTRLEDVADDVGMVGSAILYHFKDKRELYRAVRHEVFGDLREAVLRAAEGNAPADQRLEAIARAAVRTMTGRPSAASIALRESMADDPEVRTSTAPGLHRVREIFQEGLEKGDIRPVREDPYPLISAVLGAVLFYTAALPRMLPDLPPDHLAPEQLQALERDVVAMTRRLLGTDRPRATHPHPSTRANGDTR